MFNGSVSVQPEDKRTKSSRTFLHPVRLIWIRLGQCVIKAVKLSFVTPSQFCRSIVVSPFRRFASAVQYRSPFAQDSN